MGLGLSGVYGKLLTGESLIGDFVTVGADDRLREKVYLEADGQVWDVSGNQWLLGLDPRVVGVWVGRKGSGLRIPAGWVPRWRIWVSGKLILYW